MQLTADQLAQFHRDGYLAFPEFLTPREVEEARQALATLIRQYPRGRLLVQFEPGVPTRDELSVRKLMRFCEVNPFLDGLAHRHPKIRGVVESILGADPICFRTWR